jgi:DNA-binding response OmpR family regulator
MDMTARPTVEGKADSVTVAKIAPPGRRRVLLFAGDDQAVATAAPALAGLGIDVVRLNSTTEAASVPIATSVHDVLAIVAATPRSRTAETTRLVRHLRAVSSLPVLLLARQMRDDVLLQELQPASGGQVAEPVPFELAQQIRAILRRSPSRVLRFGPLEIDTGRRAVRVGQRPVELSRREFDLIAFLASSPGHTFTRRELLEAVWHPSGESQTPKTVTEHVRRIRIKLQAQPDLPNWLGTVRGTGYRFQA